MIVPAITAEALTKIYKSRSSEVRALDGLDLEVEQGTIVALLGPNGAGKTTTVRVLTTLLRPDSGRATVLGRDVVREPTAVRHLIGLSGQYAAVDEYLSGRENLEMVGNLYHLGHKVAKARATELLDQFNLSDAGDRAVKTYSGGMRRRLDLAGALVANPPLLFLDEPTTGLDPRSRSDMWEVLRDLVAAGTTVLLTTQYMEEAEQLANNIVVIDRGRIIAEGTADQLKTKVGGERLEVVVADPSQLGQARELLTSIASGDPTTDVHRHRVSIRVSTGTASLVEALRLLNAADIGVSDVALRRPTLDDVFLTLTGHAAEDENSAPDEQKVAVR
jgi:ABC-2 type transport system ATP-binding protein